MESAPCEGGLNEFLYHRINPPFYCLGGITINPFYVSKTCFRCCLPYCNVFSFGILRYYCLGLGDTPKGATEVIKD